MAELTTDCCSPATQRMCCEPSDKADCCGDQHIAGCGCPAGDQTQTVDEDVREAVRESRVD